jgi:uncharacterized membrane protein
MNKYLKNLHFIILGLITVIGLIWRISLINVTSFWYDEAFTGLMVRADWGEMIAKLIQDRVHPPLYYALIKLFAEIFGNTDTVLRAFSLVCGVLLIISSYFVVKTIVGKKAGIVATILISFNPLFITYSLEARSYAMVALLGSISLYFFWKVIHEKKGLWMLILISVLMLLTHYISLYLVVVYFVWILFKSLNSKFQILNKLTARKPNFNLTTFLVIGLLISIIVISIFNINSINIIPRGNTPTWWLPDAQLGDLLRMEYSYLFGVDRQVIGPLIPFNLRTPLNTSEVSLILFSLFSFALTYFWIKKDRLVIKFSLFFITIICLVYGTSVIGMNFMNERYLIAFGVVYVYLIAIMISKLKFNNIILLIVIYILLLTRVEWTFRNPDFKSNIHEIIEVSDQYNKVVIDNPFSYLVMEYYVGNRIPNLYALSTEQYRVENWAFFNKVIFNLEEDDLLFDSIND